MLSKADAARMFTTSKEQWKDQVIAAHSAGVGKAAFDTNGTITLIAPTPAGVLKVSPIYTEASGASPHRIVVSVEQPIAISAITQTMNDADLLQIIEKARREMLPEYTVLTKIDLTERTVQYDFFIFRVGTIPDLDRLAIERRGCWDACIQR